MKQIKSYSELLQGVVIGLIVGVGLSMIAVALCLHFNIKIY